MKFKALLLVFVVTFSLPSSATASTYIQWTAFGSSYQSASFSYITEPIVVSPTDIRKINYATLPICQSLKENNLPEVDCIKSIEAKTNGKDWVPGSLNSYIQMRAQAKDSPASLTTEWARTNIDLFPGELKNNIAGSRSSLWTFPGITHKNGNQFLVSYQIGTPVYNDNLNYLESFTEIEVQPVVPSLEGTAPGPDEKMNFSSLWSDSEQCFRSSKVSYCLQFYPFDNTDLKFRFTINLTNASESLKSKTWMYTHSFSPYIQQNRVSGSLTSQEIIFELSPTAVQIPTIVLDSESLVIDYVEAIMPPLQNPRSELFRISYEETKKQLLEEYLKGIRLNNGNYSVGVNENSFALGSTYLMGKQDKFMSPKNTDEFIGLRVQSLPLGSAGASGELYQTLESCPSSFGIAGVISTNATAAETTPPTLDKATQTLKYRVAAPHLKENGDLNSGFYRLQLNPQVAKCIWGENLLGAKAEVSVVSDSGEVQVTTSTFVFNEKAAIFEVSGFHYSAGTINIKLVTPPTVKAAAVSPKAAPSKKLTISCVKGKLIKKVTGINPKCPAGYKKK
jgi:hypothetical protein